MIEFVWLPLALLLPLPFLLSALKSEKAKSAEALKVAMSSGFLAIAGGRTSRLPRYSATRFLLWLIWLLLVLALMRPQWIGHPVSLPVSGRDLLLAVDISGSMNQEDMILEGSRVSRLDMVKAVVKDFVNNRTGDRIGLLLFGTHAYLQAPLTFDRKTVGELLQDIPVSVAGGKTAIGNAIGLAIKQFIRKETDDRILILLTDGINNAGELKPLTAARLAAQENIRIYTIGVGGGSPKISGPLGMIFGINARSTSDLDEPTLKKIAEVTGGKYFYADNTDKLREVYRRLNAYEPVMQEDQIYRPTDSLTHYPLALAFVFSLLLAALLLFRRLAFARSS